MKICFVIANISNCGGTERVTLSIANELCNRGYDVSVLSHYGNGTPFFHCDQRVVVHTLFSSKWEINHFAYRTKYIIIKSAVYFRWTQPDVVIDTEMMTPNLTIPALKGTGVKHIVWDHLSYEYFKKASPCQIALSKIKAYGSHIITLTKRDRFQYIEQENVPVERVHQIYNPLTLSKETPIEHTSQKVLAVGRFAREKGFDLLLKAWKIVEEQNPDWSLEIWGDTGSDTGDVHETFKELKLKRASLNGKTNQIANRFEDASIYVLSSRYEPLGLVLLEASVFSLPLVAFDCPNGPREIIKDGESGILVAPENVDALANAILKLIKDKELREQMGRNAFLHSKEFHLEKIIPLWESVLSEVVNS